MSLFSWRSKLTIAMLVATWGLLIFTDRRQPEDLARPLESLPRLIGSWSGTDHPPLQDSVLSVLRPTSYLSRRYIHDDRHVDFFMAYYAMQRAGESMHSPRNCLPGSGWEVWGHSTAHIALEGRDVAVNLYRVHKGTRRLLVLYWYQTSDRIIASEYWAKACLAWDAIAKGRTSGAIVRLTLPDETWALGDGIDFASQVIPLLQACLPRHRASESNFSR